MKKLVLLSVLALVGLSAGAQLKTNVSATPKTNAKVVTMPQTKRSFQAVAPRQDLTKRNYPIASSKLTLDPAKLTPVTSLQRKVLAAKPAIQNKMKAYSNAKMQNRNRLNLQPTMNPQIAAQAKAASKAPGFAKKYTGTGLDYSTDETVQWTMTPASFTYQNEETGETENVDVLVDIIPTPSYLSRLYPEGIPVEYTVDENNTITIEPQSIASYQNEAQDSTVYLTLFSADSENGNITIEVGDNGKLTITDGSYICLGEFLNVEYDEAVFDSDAFLGWDELFAGVAYYYRMETSWDGKYNAHGVSYFDNEPVNWTMQRGTSIKDDEVTKFILDLTPRVDMFSSIYPDGIDVEYEQNGNTLVVKPQVIASMDDPDDGRIYVLISSGTSDDGNIVLTEEKTGLATIEGESIIIGAWTTSTFDPTYNSYLGGYLYIDNPTYRLPDAPAVAPKDVACEPEELVLFAGLGYSGYSYNDNLAIMGAYAPTNFNNLTFDIATGFNWSVTETDDDIETTLTGRNRDFSLFTKGGAVYSDFSLTGYNEKEASEPYNWGTGHCLGSDGSVRYEAIRAYAGQGASYFNYGDGTYAVMTRQNPDYDLTFYVNWATPDIAANYGVSSMSTIYSYQGKPATPLYLTGVTLPMVSFSANDDFNLHLKLCKCSRNARGTLTLGDVIAEGDATLENVNDEYDAGITAVEFTELYVEDEFGMSETVDYLFVEDEFVIVIEGWDNGTFSGVLGSQEYNFNENTSTWFQATGETRMRSYSGGWPQLFIGLLDATYGYLHTEQGTDLVFNEDGGMSMIHIDPMYYAIDDETEEPTYLLNIESIFENDEETDDIPEWVELSIANEDYTTATEIDDDGQEYTYFVNGIDYDLVVTTEALPKGVENRTCQIVFFQTGAKLTVTINQVVGGEDAISTIVEKTPIKNSRAYNLAGQQVGKNYKGVVVKEGKKVIVK